MKLPNLLGLRSRDSVRCPGREYVVVTCESEPAAIRAALPRPLEPDGSNTVRVRFIATPDPSGSGSFVEADLVVPARFGNTLVDYTAHRYATQELPQLAGAPALARAWPRRDGRARLLFMRDTVAGVLEVDGRPVALAGMGSGKYGWPAGAQARPCTARSVRRQVAGAQVNLKRVAAGGGRSAVAQLVAAKVELERVHAAWAGPARLQRAGCALTPIAEFPLRRIVGGLCFVADVTLCGAQLLFDYRREAQYPASAPAWLGSGLALRLQEAA